MVLVTDAIKLGVVTQYNELETLASLHQKTMQGDNMIPPLIVTIIVILIFSLVGFIGGLLVGLHETVGWLINISFFITVMGWMFWDFLSNPDVTVTRTNYEAVVMTALSIVCVVVGAFSWLVGRELGEWIKKLVGGKDAQ